MSDLNSNFELSLKHEMRARELIGRSGIVPSSLALDREFGTDLVCLHTAHGRVAMRTRRHDALVYGDWQFTIRSRARGGCESEFQKFMSGECDYMFYGVLNEKEDNYERWMLFSLQEWRKAMREYEDEIRSGCRPWKPFECRNNSDGSQFMAFNATNVRFKNRPLFMKDCWAPEKFPGRVAVMSTWRQPDRSTVRRMVAA